MKTNRILGIIALAIWSHLLLYVYPLPFQREVEVHELARQSIAAEKTLQGLHVDISSGTEQEWVDGLNRDFWRMWIENLLLLLFGFIVSYWALTGRRGWQLALVLPSAIAIYMAAGPIASDLWERGPSRIFEVWKIVIGRKAQSGESILPVITALYWMFAWPLYHVCLAIAVAASIAFTRRRRAQEVQST